MKFLDSLLSRFRRAVQLPSPQDTLSLRFTPPTEADVRALIGRLGERKSSGFTSNNTTWGHILNWNSTLKQTGGPYPALGSAATIAKTFTVGTQAANAAVGGGDLFFSFQQAIVAGGSATINLASMTDIMQRASIVPVRLKQLRIRLLSAADDSTISPAPTATSTLTVTNIGVAVPSPFTFNNTGSGGTVTLTTSGGAVTATVIAAGGTGYPLSAFFLASPQQASGSGNVFLCTTNGSGVITTTTFIAGTGGSGYTNAAVPLIPVGQQLLTTGSSEMYGDTTAAGWLLPTSTGKNISLQNGDSVNAVTVELSFAGGSS